MSKDTFWPSDSEVIPAASRAVAWTNTSLLPPSGEMKPKPLEELKNFTVPMVMMNPLQNDGPDGCQDCENFKSGRVWARRAQGGSGLALLLEQSPKSYAPLLRLLQGSGSGSRDCCVI